MLDRLMRDARREGQPQIIVPVVRGVPGHPVGFSCEFFADLVALQGDRGARTVIDANARSVREVETDDDGTIRDVDERPS
jgi:molybdenum cofactor cytidylyltransferase